VLSVYPSSMQYDNLVGDCPADTCELSADFFESVYNVDTCDSQMEDVPDPCDSCGFSSVWLHMPNLKAAISSLDANKGPGNDGVPPSFVKLCADGLKSPLLHIFNLSLFTGTFHPNGRIPSSFLFPRPVNVMMLVIIVVGQYFHALRNCSRSHYYDYIFFSVKSSIMSAQHGFCKGRSTVTNLIEFTSYVLIFCMENGLQVDAIYTDFYKAFDKVSHRLLLRKLAELGFGGSLSLRNFLLG
jgi:hypothetical protein